MEAGTRATASAQGRLRNQLLNSESDISNLDQSHMVQSRQSRQPFGAPNGQVATHSSMSGSGSIQSFQQQQHMQFQQQQQQQQFYNNQYEIPMINQGGAQGSGASSSSRKASLTSQSAVNRIFRRNKNSGLNGAPNDFDDDMGADIGDLTGNVSFEDIRHMRDRGPYGMSGFSKAVDTTPIIPTIGPGGSLSLGKSASSNNIQYRKQMNHQKKLAFSQGARANSLAAGNGQQQQFQQQQHLYSMQNQANDPRMMSLGGTNGGGAYPGGPPRAMSLSANAMLQGGGPRAMSMNNRQPGQQYIPMQQKMGPMPGGGPMGPMGGPNRQPIPTRNGHLPMGISNGPRTMSLQQGQPQGPMGQQGPFPQHYPRTGSLQSGQPMHRNVVPNPNFNPNQHPQQYPMQQQQPMVNGSMQQPMANGNMQQIPMQQQQQQQQQPPQQPQQQYPQPQQYPPQSQPQHPQNLHPGNVSQNQLSNESLMHVVEEEEEPRTLAPPKSVQNTPRLNGFKEASPASTSSPKNIRKSMDLSTAVAQAAANIDDEDFDVVYNFDKEDESTLSRMSTVNKSNSMRLRKLNLFDKIATNDTQNVPDVSKSETIIDEEQDSQANPPSPKFSFTETRQDKLHGISTSVGDRESSFNNDEETEYDKDRRNSHHDKLQSIGASAGNNSNGTTLTKDVFLTASDFNSPHKSFGITTPSKENAIQDNSRNEEEEKRQGEAIVDEEEGEITKDEGPHNVIKTRGSPVLNAVQNSFDSDSTSIISRSRTSSFGNTNKPLPKQPSISKLVANTAFSNFRSPSMESGSGSIGAFRSPSVTENDTGRFRSGSVTSINRSESPLPPLPKEASENNAVTSTRKNLDTSDDSIQSENGINRQTSKPGRRPPPPSMLLPLEINEEKNKMTHAKSMSTSSNISENTREGPPRRLPPPSSMLLPLDFETPENNGDSTTSLNGELSGYRNSDAPGTSSSKFSSSDKTTFDSSKDNLNVSDTSSVYNSDVVDSPVNKSASILGSSTSVSIAAASTAAASSTSSDIAKTPILEDSESFGEVKKSNSKSFSLKSRNLMNSLKRLPGRRSSQSTTNADDESAKETKSPGQSGRRRFSGASFSSSGKKEIPPQEVKEPAKPFKFTKEELSIMNCNNELLNELELVTTELASAVQRELTLENKLRGGLSPQKENFSTDGEERDLQSQLSHQKKQIAELQDKLNKERRLRFISEEHALLMENGINPSPLKLNYEKTEVYRQLLLKNDLINQLQDRLDEYERQYGSEQNINGIGSDPNMSSDSTNHHNATQNANTSGMLDSYNELLKENTDLKFRIIPDLEKKLQYEASKSKKEKRRRGSNSNRSSTNGNGMTKQLSLTSVNYDDLGGEDEFYDEEYEINQGHLEIQQLKNQREELREVISKLTSAQSYESKFAQDKIKVLEAKLLDANSINEMLSRRLGAEGRPSPTDSSSNLHLNNKGGKLHGFNVVSSTQKLFDK